MIPGGHMELWISYAPWKHLTRILENWWHNLMPFLDFKNCCLYLQVYLMQFLKINPPQIAFPKKVCNHHSKFSPYMLHLLNFKKNTLNDAPAHQRTAYFCILCIYADDHSLNLAIAACQCIEWILQEICPIFAANPYKFSNELYRTCRIQTLNVNF